MTRERPLILVVAMAASVHTARWLDAARDAPFRFVLISVLRDGPVTSFGKVALIRSAADAQTMEQGTIGMWAGSMSSEIDLLPPPIFHRDRAQLIGGAEISAAVELLQPALVHSMELQHAGYACFGAAQRMGAGFPKWLVSNWGSDLQLYRKLPEHRVVLEGIVRRMDAYIGECRRDIGIARELGYIGLVLDTIPASCGTVFAALPSLPDLSPPSARREIVIKGYHGWSGRALHVLSAIHLAAPHLSGFRIRVALGSPPVAAMADMIRARDRLDIVMEPFEESHAVALQRLAAARLTVGMGISDGIGTTTLEAMALGSFPIAGMSSCAGEWLRDGLDGVLVDPHDVAGLARALEIGATDDRLVDEAAVRNRAYVELHWDANRNGQIARSIYERLLASC